MTPASPVVDVGWLAARIGDPRLVVADVRWYLSRDKKGIDAYRSGHIQGAAFVDLDSDLAAPPHASRPGRHPLPSADAFGAFLGRLGLGPQDTVVAYDDAGGAYAARFWWLLHYFGHATGAILDGGVQAWVAAGHALDKEPFRRASAPAPVLTERSELVVDKHRVAQLLRAGAVVLDARARERYEGKVEPIDARPGHIPGAKSAPFVENLVSPSGPFRPIGELRERYGALGALAAADTAVAEAPTGARTVIAYCGSGATACHDLLALTLAGRPNALLYEGPWSDWAADPALPAATGSEP